MYCPKTSHCFKLFGLTNLFGSKLERGFALLFLILCCLVLSLHLLNLYISVQCCAVLLRPLPHILKMCLLLVIWKSFNENVFYNKANLEKQDIAFVLSKSLLTNFNFCNRSIEH